MDKVPIVTISLDCYDKTYGNKIELTGNHIEDMALLRDLIISTHKVIYPGLYKNA